MDQVSDDTSPEPHEADGAPSGEPIADARPPVDYEPTGVESVDRVLAEVATVVDRPVGEHVEVFERAHEQLRRALDAQPGPASEGGQGA
ncbi:hypothetical protein [Nocardioides sp.]|uniref:hypothetical protein n=1 Tax=Nocardioides sp. TaxID=35761 RepID=UPI0035AF69F2